FCAGLDRTAFCADPKTYFAVLHQFTIIGQATKRLSDSLSPGDSMEADGRHARRAYSSIRRGQLGGGMEGRCRRPPMADPIAGAPTAVGISAEGLRGALRSRCLPSFLRPVLNNLPPPPSRFRTSMPYHESRSSCAPLQSRSPAI